MILLRKIVSLNNIYLNESHWLYTLQIYTVCKSGVEISHRLMEIFLILKRLRGQFDLSCGFFRNVSAKGIVNATWWKFGLYFVYIFIADSNFLTKFYSSDPSFDRNVLTSLYLKPETSAHVQLRKY